MSNIITSLASFNPVLRILLYISLSFSLLYLIIAFFEILHIIYNHFRPNYIWQRSGDNKHYIQDINKRNRPSWKLISWVIFYFALIILLMIVAPLAIE